MDKYQGFFDDEELRSLNFNSIGSNVKISKRASIYGSQHIAIGDNVRIDDYCIISAGPKGIHIGSHIHIGCFSYLIGQEAIVLGDFSGLSGRVAIYSSSDDFSGKSLFSPVIPACFKSVKSEPVTLEKYALVGTGSTLLPGAILKEGACLGAHSLFLGVSRPYKIYAGVPAKIKGDRSSKMLTLAEEFLRDFYAP